MLRPYRGRSRVGDRRSRADTPVIAFLTESDLKLAFRARLRSRAGAAKVITGNDFALFIMRPASGIVKSVLPPVGRRYASKCQAASR